MDEEILNGINLKFNWHVQILCMSILSRLMESSMKTDISNNEIDKLEKVLRDFKDEWETSQSHRAFKWRLYFLISFVVVLLITLNYPAYWWLGIVVIGYFAGSLFTMLRLRAKTNYQIIEHQKQLRLARLSSKFPMVPFSKD
jgi:hypothetical protein